MMKLEQHAGPYPIYLESKWIGPDLFVMIYGGDAPHVGSVSVGFVSQSSTRPRKTVSVSTLSLPGHKDYVLSRTTAERIAKKLGTSVIVCVGIHIGNATHQDIDTVIETVDSLVDELMKKIPADKS